jgi:molecular chaperone DnaJ
VIVIDFIDMLDQKHRRDVEKALADELKRDKARYKVLKMSDFGIVEMTRQRMRRNIELADYQTCPTCRGSGRSTMQRGLMRFSGVCPTCGGSGKAPGEVCPVCRGEGLVQKSELIAVRIPAGVDTGSRVRVPGRGNAGRNGGPPGDLFISIEVAPHPRFRREGSSVHVKVPITVPEATLGAKIEVPTLWGKTTIRVPPGTKSGQKFRMREQGAPVPGKKVRGDEFVEVTIVPPSFEDQRVRDLMKELERLSGPNPRGDQGRD